MTITGDDDVHGLEAIGRIAADTLQAMGRALEPGITTVELDEIGRLLLERQGARSAPWLCYDFPGTTCISINEEAAHGIPGPRRVAPGDLVNIDVSAEKNGYFADTGASFAVPPVASRLANLAARLLDVQDPLADPQSLLNEGRYTPEGHGADVLSWLQAESPLAKAFSTQPASQWLPGNRHSEVYTKSLVVDGSVTSRQVSTFLDLLLALRGHVYCGSKTWCH